MPLHSDVKPSHRVPPEIFEEIFFQCLPIFPTLSHKDAPLLLCQVCSSWRSIALESSRLWIGLSISIADLSTKRSESAPTGSCHASVPVRDFLQKSKNRLLSLQFTAFLPALLDSSEWREQLGALLAEFHQRIELLELSSSWLSKVLYSLPDDANFPYLSELTITSTSGPSLDYLPLPVTAFTHSRHLQRVTYNAYISHATVLNLAIPWGQLTHLILNGIDYVSWNHIFPYCRNLQLGAFVISGTPQLSPIPADIAYPYLTNLSIHIIQSSRSPLRLKGYTFPNLKNLDLGWNHSPGFDTTFLSTIHDLHSLAISSPQCHVVSMDDVLSIINTIPTLSELQVKNYSCNNELFEALTYDEEQQRPLMPNLKKLSIQTCHWSLLCDGAPMNHALREMAASRWWISSNAKVRRLETISVETTQQNVYGVREALEQLTATGLTLELLPILTDADIENEVMID